MNDPEPPYTDSLVADLAADIFQGDTDCARVCLDWLVARRRLVPEARARARDEWDQKIAAMSDDELHQHRLHPDFEYATTEGQRKAWDRADEPPEGDGWELNITAADSDAFERFDYHEERYWRRRKEHADG